MDLDLKKFYEIMDKMAEEAKKLRKEIEQTPSYKVSLAWSKEDLAFCKVKYQRKLGEKMHEVWKLQRQVKELQDKIKELEK